MKERIKIDSLILLFTVVATAFFYQFPTLYFQNTVADKILSFFGFGLILKGIYFRMAARGHKMAYSQKGNGLVVTGLYRYVRNPMYLGTLLLGAGYSLLVWPWWILPFFIFAFYLRFKPQMMKEEAHLRSLFGESYESYYNHVPQLIPRWRNLKNIKVLEAFPLSETWSTKEKRGLIIWPVLAVVLETLQNRIFYHTSNFKETILTFLLAALTFFLYFLFNYRK